MKLTNSYLIKEIKAEETHVVRGPILRPGKSVETCIFEGDELKDTIHLGAFYNNNLVGVVSFLNKPHKQIASSQQYQLRGMAVLKSYQRLGLGNLLIAHGEKSLKTQNIGTLWCNAREIAVDFYIKNGFLIIGKPFHITDIGIHYIMYKTLQKHKSL